MADIRNDLDNEEAVWIWRQLCGCFSWQVIVIGVGTNNHGHSVEQVVDGLLEIVKTCQKKQPQAHVIVMVMS